MAMCFSSFLIKYFNFVVTIFILSKNVCFSAYCGNRLFLTYISSQVNSGCTSVNQTYSECNNINDAIITSSFNNSCFFVDLIGNVSLNVNLTLINVHGFTLHGKSKNLTVITCNNNENVSSNGILVAESSNILFTSFSLRLCGLHRNVSTFQIDKELPIFSSAIYYEGVENIFIENVEVFESNGYGITIFNPKKSCIFNSVVVSKSITKLIGTFLSFGGVYLDISSDDFLYILFNKTSLQLNLMGDSTNCKNLKFIKWTSKKSLLYSFNGATFINKPIYGENNFYNEGQHLGTPVNKGGGISIFFRNNASNKIINFTDFSIDNNKACFGGGLYLYLSKNTSNNLINFNEGFILSNNAIELGGGVCVINQALSQSNYISFVNVIIDSNSACIGGGIGIEQLSEAKISFFSTSFDSNNADIGSSLQVHNANISFTDVYITNSSRSSEFADGQGAMHATNSNLFFYGSNLITQNNNTAFVLDSSILLNQGVLKFKNNSGYQGGALGLYGESYIFFDINAIFLFENNTASKRGGAIFVHVPGPSELLSLIPSNWVCFFDVIENFTGEVKFLGNKAGTGIGNDIFTSTLETCTNTNTEVNYTESLIDVITTWPHFYFEKSLHAISTNAVNISIEHGKWNIQPGSLFKPEIVLKDEREQVVDEEVNLFFQDTRFNVDLHQIIQNSAASFRIYGPPNENTKLFIQSAASLLSFDFRLNNCGFGYDLNNNSCICNNNTEIQCFDDAVYIPIKKWVYKENMFPCPKGYCKDCSKNDSYVGNLCKLNPTNQCALNRNQSSILCSKCNTGYSVVFGSSDCKNCSGESYKAIEISITIFSAVAGCNFVLLLLNKKTFSWYLVPTIYSYQILDQLISTKICPVLLFFIELFNSVGMYRKFSLELCFYNNMNDLEKKSLMFIVALWWIVSLFFVYKIFSCFSHLFTKEAFHHSLIVVLFIVYSITAKLSCDVLVSITINNEKKILIFAEEQYLKETLHIILYAIAVFVIIAFLISFPLIILCSSLYWNLFKDLEISTIKWEFLQKFVTCFKKTMKFFTFLNWYQYGLETTNIRIIIFYFLARILLLVADQFSSSEIQPTCLSAASLCVLVFFLLLKPLSNKHHNVFHAIQLTNLFLIALWNDTYRWMYLDSNDEKKFANLINLLIFVPTGMAFFVVIILECTRFSEKLPCLKHFVKEEIPIPDRVENKYNDSELTEPLIKDNTED
ncbi:uncharacterized protein LOC105848579 isoform X2 [Hydra vulgaris]|uniref:Uncharacterized protein LOC105848579 isoform X2 n=1 Tax=Hydra vulgaris TaxID=6087 RepID=A0ABM4BDT6_HYDVU